MSRSIEFRATKRETEYDDDDAEMLPKKSKLKPKNSWKNVPMERIEQKSNNLKEKVNTDRNQETNRNLTE